MVQGTAQDCEGCHDGGKANHLDVRGRGTEPKRQAKDCDEQDKNRKNDIGDSNRAIDGYEFGGLFNDHITTLLHLLRKIPEFLVSCTILSGDVPCVKRSILPDQALSALIIGFNS